MPQTLDFDKTLLPIELKIAWVYERDLEREWVAQAPETIKKIGEKRLREFAASRKALAEVTGFDDYEKLEIVAHRHLRHCPSLQVSLSHTRGLSAAVASDQVRSLGIDIEHKERQFNERTAKFFKREEDIDLPLLQLWGVKEAAFKALDPLGMRAQNKSVLVLKDLVVGHAIISLEGQVVAAWNLQIHNDLQTAVAWVN